MSYSEFSELLEKQWQIPNKLNAERINGDKQIKQSLTTECKQRIAAIEHSIEDAVSYNTNIFRLLRFLRLYYLGFRCVREAQNILEFVKKDDDARAWSDDVSQVITVLIRLNNKLQSTQTKLQKTLQCL